jgi:hypothetical protein
MKNSIAIYIPNTSLPAAFEPTIFWSGGGRDDLSAMTQGQSTFHMY